MQIKILYDNKRQTDSLLSGWGFSCLIENGILFDTGENWEYLNKNSQELKVDFKDLKAVVISHYHWDHTGGLSGLLRKVPGLPVYGLAGFGPGFQARILAAGGEFRPSQPKEQILPGIFLTGEIKGEYKTQPIAEQALVLDTRFGLSVVTGCAHPGIIVILKTVRQLFPSRPFYAVLGGFHLRPFARDEIERIIQEFLDLGIKRAGPTHCSGEMAEDLFREKYAEEFLDVGVGAVFDV